MSEWHTSSRDGITVRLLEGFSIGISQPCNAQAAGIEFVLHPDEARDLIAHLTQALEEFDEHPKL